MRGGAQVPRILYGVSPIGLGHAVRSLVIVRLLQLSGAEVLPFSGGKAATFMTASGLPTEDIVVDSGPQIVGGEMKNSALWYLRSWMGYRQTKGRTERLVGEFHPDVVVGDEEFTGPVVAKRMGIKNVLISDELELGFAKSWLSKAIESRVETWYAALQKSVSLLIVPDDGVDLGNVRYVGRVVRPVTKTRHQVVEEFNLPQEGNMVLFSMSGSGIGDHLTERVLRSCLPPSLPDAFLVVTGNRGTKIVGEGVYDLGLVLENQNLVSSADLVISTAGKSTIDEAAAAGTPIIPLPIRHHAEQERNASALGYSDQDIDRLPELVRAKIGRREAPKTSSGGENASRLILSLV